MSVRLNPISDADVPSLELVQGAVVVHWNGTSRAFSPAAGPKAPACLGFYGTEVKVPRTRARPRGGAVPRSGVRLEARDGTVLAWLANTDHSVYKQDEILQFAEAAHLRVVDHGWIDHDRLMSQSDAGSRIGPGTSLVSSYVAPRQQWLKTGAVLGGILLLAPAAVSMIDHGPGWLVAVAIVLLIAALFLGAAIGPALGIMVLAGRERRWLDRHGARGLRAPGVPGLSVVPAEDDVYVFGPFDRVNLGSGTDAAIQPFALDREHWPVGLVLSATGCKPIAIPAEFDEPQVTDFANRYGLAMRPVTRHESAVPKLHRPLGSNVFRRGGRYARALSRWWLRLAWLPFAVVLLSLAAIALGIVVLASGDKSVGLPVLLTGIGGVITVLAGLGLAWGDATLEFTRPDTIPEPARVR